MEKDCHQVPQGKEARSIRPAPKFPARYPPVPVTTRSTSRESSLGKPDIVLPRQTLRLYSGRSRSSRLISAVILADMVKLGGGYGHD